MQLVFLIVNIATLCIRFMGTILFKGRLINIIFSEFKWMMVSWASYLCVSILCRAINYIELEKCNSTVVPCNGMSPAFVGLYVLNRLASIFYYFAFYRGLVKICDLKYYRDSRWLRKRLVLNK